MNLPVQHIQISGVAEASFDLGGFAASLEPCVDLLARPCGQCFALSSEPLTEQAEDRGLAWHVYLSRLAVVGLWHQRSRCKVYVCYTLHPGLIRLFICSHQKRFPESFARVIQQTPACSESGRESFSAHSARPLAYWEPPATAVALWPTGLDGETDGARVVDTGNALSYFSYPESEHAGSVPVVLAGPDYVRVPQEERTAFNVGNRVYHCLNRWAAVEMSEAPSPAKF